MLLPGQLSSRQSMCADEGAERKFCRLCGGVGAEQRIRELEVARDSQAAQIKRLRQQVYGRTA